MANSIQRDKTSYSRHTISISAKENCKLVWILLSDL